MMISQIMTQIQIFLYAMQCALFSHQTLCFKCNFERFIWVQKKERKMLNKLKRNFKRKVYINCLMSQVLFFFCAGRWTNGKRMKQNKSCLNMWRHRISPIWWYTTWKQSLFHCLVNCQKYIIDLTSCSMYRHFFSTCKWYSYL